jgi:hypothetical protein
MTLDQVKKVAELLGDSSYDGLEACLRQLKRGNILEEKRINIGNRLYISSLSRCVFEYHYDRFDDRVSSECFDAICTTDGLICKIQKDTK